MPLHSTRYGPGHWAVLLGLLSRVGSVLGQASSNATCNSGFTWMLNPLDQNPCLVAAYLSDVCATGQWNVPALDIANGIDYYASPGDTTSGTGANLCMCSTAVYSLYSACAYCQGGTYDSWDDWVQYCPTQDIFVDGYPYPVPEGTAVPDWAFELDPTVTGTWDEVAAKQYAEGSKHKSSVGAIAGGVVGGVVVLILIALAIFVVRRRRRNRQGAADRVTPTPYGANHPGIDQGYSYNDGNGEKNAPNGTEYGVPVTYTGGQQAPSPTEGGSMRPYNPSDPSTFPGSPVSTANTYTSHGQNPIMNTSHGYSVSNQQYQQAYPPGPMAKPVAEGYTGRPEF